jgi:U4/U6 small nuclear ribonucleoprotein PRP4
MVWDLRTGKGVYEIQQSDSILCSAFAPNGFELVAAGKNNLISVFDLRRKKEFRRIPAHLKLITDLKYEKNGLFLASASHDNTVKLWHGMNYTPIVVNDLE